MIKHRHSYEYYKEQLPKETLEKLLETNTYQDIHDQTGIDQHVISRIAKEYGIPKNEKLLGKQRNKNKLVNFDFDKVYDLYVNQGKSTIYIAKYYNCTKSTVNKYLRDNNIEVRDAHDSICYDSRRKSYAYYGIDASGYVLLKVDGKQIREHRYVMEQFLGRELSSEEHVHHIDFNKTNNDIDNLFLFPSNMLHKLYHSFIEKNPYIPPQEFLEKYSDTYHNFLSFDNLYKLYITENRSIKDIAVYFCNTTDFNNNLMRDAITKRLKDYNLFDPNNVDINQYVTKDVNKLIEKYNRIN